MHQRSMRKGLELTPSIHASVIAENISAMASQPWSRISPNWLDLFLNRANFPSTASACSQMKNPMAQKYEVNSKF